MSASTTALIRTTRPTVCLRAAFPRRLGAPSDGSGRDSSDTGSPSLGWGGGLTGLNLLHCGKISAPAEHRPRRSGALLMSDGVRRRGRMLPAAPPPVPQHAPVAPWLEQPP